MLQVHTGVGGTGMQGLGCDAHHRIEGGSVAVERVTGVPPASVKNGSDEPLI